MVAGNLSPAAKRALAHLLHPAGPPPKPVEIIKTVETVREVPVEVRVAAPEAPEHPVLGKLLHDFGCVRPLSDGCG